MTLDLRGLTVPLPVARTAVAMAGLGSGELIEVLTSDRDSVRDVLVWARATGNRLVEYRELGARFTKWRAVITIGPDLPSLGCIAANAEALGRFAATSQEAGLVPIVEPEVLMDGDHPIGRCDEATRDTLAEVFAALLDHVPASVPGSCSCPVARATRRPPPT
jgi:TusA-related sulfurtransferase